MFQIDTRFKTAQTPQGDLRVAIAGIVLAMVNTISHALINIAWKANTDSKKQ